MPKYHLLLDTSIYRKNPSRTDLPFQALERLCKHNKVQLHIPYIVEREFQTYLIEPYVKSLNTSISELNALIRRGLSEGTIDQMKRIRDEISETKLTILSDVENAFTAWANSIGAQRHSITESSTIAALESYFKGTAPLKSPKTRNDIPDAFIFQTIYQLSSNGHSLIVIVQDGNLFEASQKLPSVRAFKSLSDFIESSEIQNEILELNVVRNLPIIRDTLKFLDEKSKIISKIIESEGGNSLEYKKICSHSIPDDNHEATITSYGDLIDVDLDFDEISYFGSGEFGIPFSGSASVTITYYLYKWDYYNVIEETERSISISDHNDHYFEVEEDVEVTVYGLAKVIIDQLELENISPDTYEGDIDVTIDSIDSIELEKY